MTVKEKIMDIADDLFWGTTECGDGSIEFERRSPADEDFIFTIDGNDPVKEIRDYARDFDPEEHAEFWVRNRENSTSIPNIRILIEDADDIKKMLTELAEAVSKMEV